VRWLGCRTKRNRSSTNYVTANSGGYDFQGVRFRAAGLLGAILVWCFQTGYGQPRLPDGFLKVPAFGEDVTCAACLVKAEQVETDRVSSRDFTGFSWPFRTPPNDGLVLVNYVDDDPTNNLRDYMGLTHAYEGHRGTDVTLYTFRDMDHGVPFYAAASGTVLGTVFHYGDRNIEAPYPDTGNGIWIQHEDGYVSYYWHPRTNSIVVEPGEDVEAGQFLAFAGSSGYSTDAHLHFEVQENLGNTTVVRDPWSGTFNPGPSLWTDQLEYVGDDSLRLFDMGVTTRLASGGDLSDIRTRTFKERMSQPDTFGTDEPQLAVWFLLQGQNAETYKVELIKPDSMVFATATYDLPGKSRYAFHYWYWNLVGVTESDHGVWKAVVSSGGLTLKSMTFNVGQETVFGPRFVVAGRSLRLEGESVSDTLRMSPLGGDVTFALVDAPGLVSLEDSLVTVSYPTHQPVRSLFFDVIATDAAGRTDTMKYHVVDPSRPLDPKPLRTERPIPREVNANRVELFPNPASRQTNVRLELDRPQIVTIEIFDVLGRRSSESVSAAMAGGTQQIPIEIASLSSGTYLMRVSSDEILVTRALVVVTP